MKHHRWSAWLLAMFMLGATALGQQAARKPDRKSTRPLYIVRPWKDAGKYADQIRRQGAAGVTIPLWSYSVTSPLDGQRYDGVMVGRAPYYHGHRATVVPAVMIPVIFTLEDSGIAFDPTTPDACIGNRTIVDVVSKSPIFHSVDWVMNGVDVGNTQYTDAFRRAEFWQFVAGTPQQTLMGLSVAPAVNVTVPFSYGVTEDGVGGCVRGRIDIDWLSNYVQQTLIPSLSNQVGPANFPIFLSNSVVEYLEHDPNKCCVLGFHSAFQSNGVLQTFTIATLDDSGLSDADDVSVMSHEVAEWMDDPVGDNPTPLWGHIGQVSGCQGNLEVGDPLSPGSGSPTNGWVVTQNGFTYHLQELAFFSWFYRGSSFGTGGKYSDHMTFSSDAGPVCTE